MSKKSGCKRLRIRKSEFVAKTHDSFKWNPPPCSTITSYGLWSLVCNKLLISPLAYETFGHLACQKLIREFLGSLYLFYPLSFCPLSIKSMVINVLQSSSFSSYVYCLHLFLIFFVKHWFILPIKNRNFAIHTCTVKI